MQKNSLKNVKKVFGYYPQSSILEKCDQDIQNMGKF